MIKENWCFILNSYPIKRKTFYIFWRSTLCIRWSFLDKFSCITEHECSFLSFSFTFCRESFYFFLWNIIMSLFSFKRWKIWYFNRFSSRHHKGNFRIKKSKESFIFWLHIIIYFEMKMDKFSKLFFSNPRKKMLKYFHILPMLSDKKGRIRSFNIDRKIISIFSDREWINLDSKSFKEWLCKCFHVAYYIKKIFEFKR